MLQTSCERYKTYRHSYNRTILKRNKKKQTPPSFFAALFRLFMTTSEFSINQTRMALHSVRGSQHSYKDTQQLTVFNLQAPQWCWTVPTWDKYWWLSSELMEWAWCMLTPLYSIKAAPETKLSISSFLRGLSPDFCLRVKIGHLRTISWLDISDIVTHSLEAHVW